MKQAIIKNGEIYEVYFQGKLIGKVDSENAAWDLPSKIKKEVNND